MAHGQKSTESELIEYGQSGRVLAPVIGQYGGGGASSDQGLILGLVAREMTRKHTESYSTPGFLEANSLFRREFSR